MSDKGLLASICSFLKGLFSASKDSDCCNDNASSKPANDGLTSVERYIRNQAQNGQSLTGVERYIRNQLSNNQPLTGVEKYIRNSAGTKPLTGVERYIRSKS
ncbi:hypothetical protein Q7C_1680 [Methylophaga frappieri]|uniref:Uncharacterized protein n=1 Tax=Methylophaga frappieri (strain ATCC BAA-2434 / DSM 25690 / JAM7) TaxID=754477 RepID=I1YIT4_METFJ|nr:hypothetical protein [Methylophaga frappieri]AFJ02827.1 hypothetical protein Q7C_1680 [Methylophaga frappieri]